MRRGAILIFAFSLLFFACQTKIIYPPPSEQAFPPISPYFVEEPVPLPDLTISDVTLNETGRVVISLSNIGKNLVRGQIGNLKIYVDGDLRWSIPFGHIPDQTFLRPGGTTLYTTLVQIEGTHQVRAVIDSDEEIMEEDESNNIFTKALSDEMTLLLPPVLTPSLPKPDKQKGLLSYPDLTVTNLHLNPQKRLVIHLANIGNAPFPFREGTLKVFVDGVLKGIYPLGSLSEKPHLPPKENITLTASLTIVGRHEIFVRIDTGPGSNERNSGNNVLKKILEGPPLGPDIVVKELDLTEDFELSVVLSNAGETELRTGTTLRIRIFLNDQRVSEFDHFISEPLKPSFGTRYIIDPPYRVRVDGNARVKVVIWPKQSSEDIHLENNTLERNFVIYPIKIGPQVNQEFPLFFPSLRSKDNRQGDKIKTEVRWDGGGSPLRLSLKGTGHDKRKRIAPITGKSPLKLEVPIENEKNQKGRPWRISVANLMERRVEGHLIIQYP